LKGKLTLSTFFLAIASYLTLYPLVLIIPLVVLLNKYPPGVRSSTLRMIVAAVLFVGSIGGLLGLSYQLLGSWSFLRETYGFTMLVEELTPNIGLFWYYFVEVFEHFRNFFLFALQFNVFIYAIPLSMRLSNHPFFLFWLLLSISCTFKAYPSLGDLVLPTVLLPLFHTIVYGVHYPVVVGVGLLVATTLAPVIWHMWIYQGGGNANFYYAINLVFTLCQILMMLDISNAVVKKDYLLKHNIDPTAPRRPATQQQIQEENNNEIREDNTDNNNRNNDVLKED